MKKAVGVDIGANFLRVSVGTQEGKILRIVRASTDVHSGPMGISNQIIDMIHSIETNDVVGIGIGSAGPVDLHKGGLNSPINMPGLGFVPIVEPLRREFGLSVILQNDCVAAVMGEKKYGAGRMIKNLVYVTISTGIGAGIYVDGNLLSGKDGNAHEIGHITMEIDYGMKCGCGKLGHWEAYCSGKNIPHFVNTLMKRGGRKQFQNSMLYNLCGEDTSLLTSKMIYDIAKKGDSFCTGIIQEIGKINAIGFANIVNAYDPELITIGGSVALNNPNLVLEPITKHIVEHTINRVPRMMITPLGHEVVLHGALASAFSLKDT